jgi:N-acetylmuramoyl-L-alanine amidase
MDQARAQALPQAEGPMTPPPGRHAKPGPEAVAWQFRRGLRAPECSPACATAAGDDFTRIVLDLTGPVAFKHARRPADPAQGKTHRMYVDLDKTTLGTELKRKVEIPADSSYPSAPGRTRPAPPAWSSTSKTTRNTTSWP